MNFAVIGSSHVHIYEFIDDMIELGGKFIGIYDDGSEIAEEIIQKYNTMRYGDINELIQQKIDIVGTSAVNSRKIDIIEMCNDRGIHIIVDKPLVVDEEQYRRLEDVVNMSRIQIGTMFTLRYLPQVRRIKEIIENGSLGKLISIEILNPHRLLAKSRPDWFFDSNESGGVVIDLMVHSVDLFNWLTESEITDSQGYITKSIFMLKERFYSSAQFMAKSKCGVTGYFRVDMHMSDAHWSWGDLRVFCTGTNGGIEARVVGDPLTREVVIVLYQEGKETAKVEFGSCSNSPTKDFVDRILRHNHIVGHDDILKATKMTIDMDKIAKRIVIQ